MILSQSQTARDYSRMIRELAKIVVTLPNHTMRYLYITLISCFLALNLPMANAQIITTVAGKGTAGFYGDGGKADTSKLYHPTGVAINASGNVYIADFDNNRIRMVSPSGIISTFAGNGIAGYSGDSDSAKYAELYNPQGVAIDAAGNVYIADEGNQRIRMVNTAGIISTFAGNGILGYSGDGGQATAAEFDYPAGVACDASGNVYIADIYNNCIRKVNTVGIITTIAGNGSAAYAGDGGNATAAELFFPQGVACDASGNVYIADEANQRIRMVNTAGIISTFAGNGSEGYSGDGGQAWQAELYNPYGVACDASGNVYIADISNQRIRRVNSFGIIRAIAGKGIQGYSGDGGQSTTAELNDPQGLAIDAVGNLYIADSGNNRIRMVTNAATTGIEQFANNNEQVMVYPNPAKNVLHVECLMVNENSTMVITDMLGNTIHNSTFTTQHKTISVADLSEGIYNISIASNGALINKRVIIVR
jgi:sugar lactone lactonase YvrE